MANQPTKYRKFVVGAASAALVASAVAPVASAKDFSDSKGNTHEAAIDALSDAGIISGYEDGTFKPNKTLTRSDVVKMMGKWLVSEGYEVPSDYKTNMRFSDLTASTNDELLRFAAVVKDNGVFNGSNGRLLAGDNMSRENMAVVLVRAFDTVNDINLVEYVEGQDFKKEVTDLNSAKSEARTAINVLDFFDVTTVAQFNPKDTTTRGHFATFLNNFLKADLSNVTGTVSGVAAVKAVNATTVEVAFTEKVENVNALNFTIEGLTVSNAAVKQSDDKVVVLTTSAQEGGKKYTVAVDGKELGSFEGISAVIPTKIDITTQSVQGKVGQQAIVTADVGVKQAGIPVTFNVKAETTRTLNKDQVFEAVTNADGIATFSYTQYAAGTDSVAAYPTGAPTVRSLGYVFWGVDTILNIEANDEKGNSVNNGEDKTYKLTYLNPETGKPVANQTFFVTFKENIDVNIDKTSKATVNGVNPRQLLNNEDPVVASVTTDSKGQAVFTVSGSNTEVTPVVFFDNRDRDIKERTKYEASKLQATTETVKFGALQSEYDITVNRLGGEEAATGVANGRDYKVIVKTKDGKVAANELVNVAFNEDLDRVINTNTSAYFVDANGNAVLNPRTEAYTVKTNDKGEAVFTIASDDPKDYATPIVWIDINTSNAKEGRLDEGEPSKVAAITYFADEKLTDGTVTAYDESNNEVPRTNKKEFEGNEIATFEFSAANQSGVAMELPNNYEEIAATFTVFNTGGNDITVIEPNGDEQIVSPNRSYTTKTIKGYEKPSIEVKTGNKTTSDVSTSVRVVANGTAVPKTGTSERTVNLGSHSVEATFVSTSSVGSVYTGIVETINTEKRTIKFFGKSAVSYASATYKNDKGVTLNLVQFERLMKANEGNAKVTYKKVDDTVTFEIVSLADELVTDYDDLQTAIATANALVNGAEAGTEAGQYPQSAIDAYKSAIRTAQAVLGNVNATQEQVNTAIENLATATQTFENAVIVEFNFTTTPATATDGDTNFTFDVTGTVGEEYPTGIPQVSVKVVDDANENVAVTGINATAYNAQGKSTVTVTTNELVEGTYTVTVTINGVEKTLTLTVEAASMTATGTITISKVPDELAYGAYFAGQELGYLFNLDQDNDGIIDELSMVFSVDGRDITINTRDTQVAIRNVNAVTREELINLLVEDFGDNVKRPAFGPNRIFIASNKLGDGSSISVKEQGSLASKIGFHTIADNVPTGKDGDTITIGSMEYVFIHSDVSSLSLQNNTNRIKVVVGSTVDETAQNLAIAINSQASLDYTAIATNGVVTITAKVAGVSGNAIQLSKQDSDNDILLSDESLKGGQ